MRLEKLLSYGNKNIWTAVTAICAKSQTNTNVPPKTHAEHP
jgi:hypothetical protein